MIYVLVEINSVVVLLFSLLPAWMHLPPLSSILGGTPEVTIAARVIFSTIICFLENSIVYLFVSVVLFMVIFCTHAF